MRSTGRAGRRRITAILPLVVVVVVGGCSLVTESEALDGAGRAEALGTELFEGALGEDGVGTWERNWTEGSMVCTSWCMAMSTRMRIGDTPPSVLDQVIEEAADTGWSVGGRSSVGDSESWSVHMSKDGLTLQVWWKRGDLSIVWVSQPYPVEASLITILNPCEVDVEVLVWRTFDMAAPHWSSAKEHQVPAETTLDLEIFPNGSELVLIPAAGWGGLYELSSGGSASIEIPPSACADPPSEGETEPRRLFEEVLASLGLKG